MSRARFHSHVLGVKQKCPLVVLQQLLHSTIWLWKTLTLQIPYIMLMKITHRMKIHQPCTDVKLSTAVAGIDVHVAIVAPEAFVIPRLTPSQPRHWHQCQQRPFRCRTQGRSAELSGEHTCHMLMCLTRSTPDIFAVSLANKESVQISGFWFAVRSRSLLCI